MNIVITADVLKQVMVFHVKVEYNSICRYSGKICKKTVERERERVYNISHYDMSNT